jgi:hypothetical protein
MSNTSDTPRRWPLWLIISLMANMILVGLLAGFLMQAGPKGTPDGPPRERISWGDRDDGSRQAMRRVFKEAFKASARSARRGSNRAGSWLKRSSPSPMMPTRCGRLSKS